MNRIKQTFLNVVGPGFLMAGAAIGVSHLVQATRAGADYGFSLLWLLLLAIVSKYPFMEFGPRYAAVTGRHLIYGYHQLGRSAYFIYILITIGTMFIIQAAVTIVTAGLAEHLFGLALTPFLWSTIILGGCIALLLIGRYPGLDWSMKVIISALTVSTLAAVIIALSKGGVTEVSRIEPPSYWNLAGLAFIIAFMGWMPIPLDASVWHSIWCCEKQKQTGYKPSMREARVDFNIGYVSAALIGLLFFILGVLVMFGQDMVFLSSGVGFASQLIDLYGQTLGSWSTPIVSIAAFVTMLSTTLAVTDAYPRVLSELWVVSSLEQKTPFTKQNVYQISIFIIPAIALVLLFFLTGTFTSLVDFAAGLSFLAAPVLAWFNLKLISGDYVPEDARPGKTGLIFAWSCLIFLMLFTLVYIYWRFWIG